MLNHSAVNNMSLRITTSRMNKKNTSVTVHSYLYIPEKRQSHRTCNLRDCSALTLLQRRLRGTSYSSKFCNSALYNHCCNMPTLTTSIFCNY